MNIAFLTPEYISNTEFSGGLANYLYKVTHLLNKTGHQSTVITLSLQNRLRNDDGVQVKEIKGGSFFPTGSRIPASLNKWIGIINRFLSAKKIAHNFWEMHNKTSFDIVQTSSYMTPGLTLVRNGKVPVVCRVSSYSPLWRSAFGRATNLDSVISDYFEIRQAALADAVFAPSEFLVRTYERMSGIRARLLRSPLVHSASEMDTEFFSMQRPNRQYMLYFGTLNRIKGVDLLAEVLPPFFQQHPEFDVVLIGNDGGLPDGNKMMALLSRACGALSERFHYFPPMPKNRLYPFVENAFAVLIPSRVDNYPNTCLESQMFGVPVVATDESSLEEMISEGINGFIGKNGDAGSYLRAMLRCGAMSSEERGAMKRRILEINKKVEAEDRIGNLIAYYEEVIRQFGRKQQPF